MIPSYPQDVSALLLSCADFSEFLQEMGRRLAMAGVAQTVWWNCFDLLPGPAYVWKDHRVELIADRKPGVALAELSGVVPSVVDGDGGRYYPAHARGELVGILGTFPGGQDRGLIGLASLFATAWERTWLRDQLVDVRAGNLGNLERTIIQRALEKTRGKIYGPDGAAKALAMNPATLYGKMKRLGIPRPPK